MKMQHKQLCDHFFTVSFKEHSSCVSFSLLGYLKALFLGPLLITLYKPSWGDLTKSHCFQYRLFTYTTQLYFATSQWSPSTQSHISKYL